MKTSRALPLVGIAVPLDEDPLDEKDGSRPGRRTRPLDAAYARAVAEAGGAAVYLPGEGDAAGLAERMDALLLPGGGDFLPEAPYPPDVRFAPAAPAQLAFDHALLDAALERGIPVLGICYGLQLLALHHGGRLLHHVPLDVPGAGEHRLADPEARHGLAVEAGSRLCNVLAATRTQVNSRHHQAVAEPGRGLRVCARADDGLVEAVEAEDGRFVLGVQWHPESMDAEHRARLFGAFLAAARARVG